MQKERYQRQLILEQIGETGQEKLKNSKVLVIGAGGLGSSVLYYLTAAGIGTVGVLDYDIVNLSNLNRQILHNTNDIGALKVDSAFEKLNKLNPECTIITLPLKLDNSNSYDIFKNYDIIVDATDNLETRIVINKTCQNLKIPLVHGAILGFEGIIISMDFISTPCLMCLYNNYNRRTSTSLIGVFGATAGTIGSLQAQEVIKIVLNIGEPLFNKILTYNGLKMDFNITEFKKDSNCPICGN